MVQQGSEGLLDGGSVGKVRHDGRLLSDTLDDSRHGVLCPVGADRGREGGWAGFPSPEYHWSESSFCYSSRCVALMRPPACKRGLMAEARADLASTHMRFPGHAASAVTKIAVSSAKCWDGSRSVLRCVMSSVDSIALPARAQLAARQVRGTQSPMKITSGMMKVRCVVAIPMALRLSSQDYV